MQTWFHWKGGKSRRGKIKKERERERERQERGQISELKKKKKKKGDFSYTLIGRRERRECKDDSIVEKFKWNGI